MSDKPLYIDIKSFDSQLDILVDSTEYPEVAEQILQLFQNKPGLINDYKGFPLTLETKYGIKDAILQTIQSYINSGEQGADRWPSIVVRVK